MNTSVTKELLEAFARRCESESDHLSVRESEIMRWKIEQIGPQPTAEDLDELMEELRLWLQEQDPWDLLHQERRRLAASG